MTALRTLTDADWQRMPWAAKQRWLIAANALRRQVSAELDALERDKRSRLVHFAALAEDVARKDRARAAMDATLGPERLRLVTRAVTRPGQRSA